SRLPVGAWRSVFDGGCTVLCIPSRSSGCGPRLARRRGSDTRKEGCVEAMRTFLSATDFSPGAQDAVRRAALLAAEQSGRVELLHVVSGSSLRRLGGLLGLPADIQERLTEEARSTLERLAAEVARESA